MSNDSSRYRAHMADDPAAFPILDDADIAVFDELGTRRPLRVGDYLYREGDPTYDFHVIVHGEVEIFVSADGEERVIAHHGPGRFLGELNMLTGLRVQVSARVVAPGEAIVVPRDTLRSVLATHPRLGDIVLAAFLARRSVLLESAGAALRVLGSRFSPETRQIREYLSRSRIPHEWLDPDSDEHVDGVLREFAVAPAELPVVITAGSVMRHPTPGVLAEYLGLTLDSVPGRCFDVVIVGGGPAGLAAAVYGASEGLRTLGVEMVAVGGQAGGTSRIENYLGFPTGISGVDLTHRALVQAEKFGANLSSPCAALSLREEAGHLVLRLSDGSEVAGRAVIAATGARYRRLDVDGLEDFEGSGVYYAATDLEARACSSSPVVVVGGGNSAGQAAEFLAEAGSPVTLVIRRPDLGASMSRYLVDRIEADKRIDVFTRSEITALDGDVTLASVRISGADGDVVVPCAGLFSFIGAEPSSAWLSGCAALDDRGFVLTDRSLGAAAKGGRWESLGRGPLPYESSHPGLFAVGDLRAGSTKRVAAAVGEGSAAVRSVHDLLAYAH